MCGLGDATLDLVGALVDRSLVVAVPQADGPTRYRMLETIREYAAQRLDEAGERSEVEAAHAASIVALLETAEPRLRRPGQLEWMARLRAEADDVDAVLRRAVAAGDADTAQRLVAAATWFWIVRGLYTEASDRLTAACALDGPTPPAVRALCTAYRAMVAAGAGDLAAALDHLAVAEGLAAELPADRHPVLLLMGPITAGFRRGGDPGPLDRLAADPHADPWARAFAAFCLAQFAENEGDRERQRTETRAAHAMFAALGDRFGLGMTLSSLGDLENVAGAYDAAEAAFDEVIALATELGNTDDLPQFQTERARLLVRRGDLDAGRAELRRIAARPRLHPELAGAVHLFLADAARRAGDLDDARDEIALADPTGYPGGLGSAQRRALYAAVSSAVARATGDGDTAAALLAEALTHAVESGDGPVIATVAELAAGQALAGGDAATAAALLGVGAAQRGASDVGDPEVRACLAGVRAALGPDAADREVERARTLPRHDGLALAQGYVRGAGSLAGPGSTPAGSGVTDSASATSRA